MECDSVYSMGAMGRDTAGEEQGGAGEWRCMVTATHKLIVRRGNVNNGIFDLEKDPYEMNNLWSKPEAADLQNRLVERMKRWQKETGDSFPAKCKAAQAMYEKG